MKNILVLTLLFIISLSIGMHFRNEIAKEEEYEEYEEREDGPEEFLKFHKGIRTRADEDRPTYPQNYQLIELQKAQQISSPQKASVTARIQSNSNGVIAFTERGPGNVPGRTRGLIVDPDDASHKTWYAGSASGGIWKTLDAGTSWQWITPFVPNMATTCLAMAESNHSVIYAGTGEGFGLVDGVDGMGIFKSTDKGGSWNALGNSSSLGNVNRIAVDPANENYVLAVCNSGIFLSINGGLSWTKVYSGVVQDLRPVPGNFSILYAAEYGVGVIKSTNKGATWARSNTGMFPKGRIEIAVSPAKTDRIVASAQGSLSGAKSDLYMSDDAGVTWNLVTLSLSSKTLDYLGDQGWYDNTVAFSPYNKDVVYVGGIGAYQITLGSPIASSSGDYTVNEKNTSSFLSLVNFGATAYGGKLEVDAAATHDTVEVRFGPGITQKAHRFLVPVGATSGVLDANYGYQDYVDVPFQVWNVSTHQQLMVSFRDQDRNGIFNLLLQNTTATDATQQSREYIIINNVPYNPTTTNTSIAIDGGQVFQKMYFFWPVLASGATWDPTTLPGSSLQISYSLINKYSSTVMTVTDSYNDYDGVNNSNLVHPDQHNIYPIRQNDATKTFQLLMANDGGVFLSSVSTSPGTTQGEWKKVGNGYNTSQFYGVDKKPGAQEYIGGMQDNSTYYTPNGTISSSATSFVTNSKLAGDGFEVLWHNLDKNKMIGGSQFNNFARSLDGGASWSTAFSGLTLSGSNPDQSKFPFISKLANSHRAPDNIYTVGSEGVWRSTNFGDNWTLTPITSGWGLTSFTDVEVSRANANIVWAGSGQSSTRNLFVSTDAGQTFNATVNPSGLTLGNITRIATHPLEPNTAYALYSFAKTAKIFKTTNLGQTWTDISGFGTGQASTTGFPDVAVYSLYVRPDNPNIIWAGTEIGIVESLDGGTSWALLNTFPSVAVWDMKGQDNEIVIATHGRGIWTATIAKDQNGVSKVLNMATTPQSKFKMTLNVPYRYDSVLLKFNSTQTVKFIPPDSGTFVLQIANVPTGSLSIQTTSYKGGTSTTSILYNGVYLKLSTYQQKHYDYFISDNNFYSDGFTVLPFGTSNSSLQSQHNYSPGKNATAVLLVPIIVSSDVSIFIYDDVTLVQPGATGSTFGQSSFNDYVIAEGTKDGLTWIPISNGYNSSANSNWLSAFNSLKSGDRSLTVTESFDLKNNFKAGDTLLIRFSLYSNGDNTVGWGWSIDNLFIQQTPTAIEPVSANEIVVYPNPSSGKFSINYSLTKDSEVDVNIWDATGRSVSYQNFGARAAGKNQVELALEGMPDGVYIGRLKTADGEHAFKVVMKK